ncbi:MAG: glycosyltransferase family 9 protein [Salinivirgaceae bacterium]|nr:glycosyltransferase family 9 protein [Salinivirgaceae bacterium]
MNTRTQIIIDKGIVKPIAYFLNFLTRFIGFILKIDHKLNKEFHTIAICKFKGMGSIIQSTPMIQAIRNKYPNSKIIFISSVSNKNILEKITLINKVILINDKSFTKLISSTIISLFQLIKTRPQIYFDLEIYSDFSTLFTLLSLSVNRVGFYLRSSSYRMGIYTHMMFFNPRVPISEVYLQLARLIHCKTDNCNLYKFDVPKKDYSNNTKPYIVINPNASDLRLERRWGKENFIELVKRIIIHYPNFDIFLIGSQNEKNYCNEIESEINNDSLKNYAGKTSIDELFSLISNSELIISNDTGPMHIAFSQQTPIVCLFGPCSPEQYGMNNNAIVVYKNIYCSPCVHDFEIAPCKGNNVCMKLITLTEVLESIEECFKKNPAKFTGPKFKYNDNETIFGTITR